MRNALQRLEDTHRLILLPERTQCLGLPESRLGAQGGLFIRRDLGVERERGRPTIEAGQRLGVPEGRFCVGR